MSKWPRWPCAVGRRAGGPARGTDDAGLRLRVAAVAAEPEQLRLAAIPASLELDGGQVVAVIESGGDQKQCVEIGGVLENE